MNKALPGVPPATRNPFAPPLNNPFSDEAAAGAASAGFGSGQHQHQQNVRGVSFKMDPYVHESRSNDDTSTNRYTVASVYSQQSAPAGRASGSVPPSLAPGRATVTPRQSQSAAAAAARQSNGAASDWTLEAHSQ